MRARWRPLAHRRSREAEQTRALRLVRLDALIRRLQTLKAGVTRR